MSSRSNAKDDTVHTITAHKFSQLMMEGRVRATLQLLTKETQSGPLRLDDAIRGGSGKTVRDVLEDKHPDLAPIHPVVILSKDMTSVAFHVILF